MYENDFSNLGRKIQDTVQQAMDSMDFRQLNDTINHTVDQALNEARMYQDQLKWRYQDGVRRQEENFKWQAEHLKRQSEQMKQQAKSAAQTFTRSRAEKVQTQGARPLSRREKNRMIQQLMSPKIKKGTGHMIVGGLLSAFSLVGMITVAAMKKIFAMIGTAALAEAILGPGILFIFFIIGLILFAVGKRQHDRYRRARTYIEILNGRGFCELKELAQETGMSEEEVRKDIRKMLQKRVFREGHMDRKETCFMINETAYRYYLQAEESLRQREQEEAKRKEQESQMKPEILEMIRVGDEYIRQIREANDDIPGEIISNKLDRLEQVVRRIFESVKKHPEQKKEMDKFMDYYMPTTLKLVNAYREFDALEVKGENVMTAMQEIEHTLDTISKAFEKLLDDLFQDAAFDVSTDISVLQMMLAREGYKEKDFE